MSLPHQRRWQPLPSADAIAGNEDLMTQILIRLPAKSLCRFKCVSKRWYSLISHPHFSLLCMPKSVSGFFLYVYSRGNSCSYKYIHLTGKRTRSAPFKSLTFVDDPLGIITIIHSCNGLLLCSPDGKIRKSNKYIYNPTTKQFAIIPPLWDDAKPAILAMNLAFDPSRAPHYKIVLVRSRPPPSDTCLWTNQIEIYSSETGSWRLSGDPFTATLTRDFKNGVFFNGMIHWSSSLLDTSFRFDVDQERLGIMPIPTIQDGRDEMTICYFGESRGYLHLICGYNTDSTSFDVLEMESDYSKWFLKYRLHLDAITTTFPGCTPLTTYSMLHLVRGADEEKSYLVLYIPGMILSYNFKDKTLKKFCNSERYVGRLQTHQYIETFFRI